MHQWNWSPLVQTTLYLMGTVPGLQGHGRFIWQSLCWPLHLFLLHPYILYFFQTPSHHADGVSDDVTAPVRCRDRYWRHAAFWRQPDNARGHHPGKCAHHRVLATRCSSGRLNPRSRIQLLIVLIQCPLFKNIETTSLKSRSCHDANFFITGGIGGLSLWQPTEREASDEKNGITIKLISNMCQCLYSC